MLSVLSPDQKKKGFSALQTPTYDDNDDDGLDCELAKQTH